MRFIVPKIVQRVAVAVFLAFLFAFAVGSVSCVSTDGGSDAGIVKVSGAVLPAAPFWCGYEMGSSSDIPNYQYDCHWVSPSGLRDTIQKYNGVVVVADTGHTLPCEGNDFAGGVYHTELVAANATCPHTFSPICPYPVGQPPFDPWAGGYPSPAATTSQNKNVPPVLSSSYFGCSFYPNSTMYGPTNYAQYVFECTNWQNGTPADSIDLWTGGNVHQGSCARIKAPTRGDNYYIDYHGFLANGWLKLANGTRMSIRSIEVGAEMNLYVSSNARVDGTAWGCWWAASGTGAGTCKRLEMGNNHLTYSLEADHYTVDTSLIAGWEAHSLMFYRVNP